MSSEICIFSIKADVKEAEGLKYGEKSSKADKTTDVKSRAVKKKSFKQKQVTRGHNFVASGWAGAFNPQCHPNPVPNPLPHTTTHPYTQ